MWVNEEGQSPISVACKYDLIDIILRLLQKAGNGIELDCIVSLFYTKQH